MAKKLSCLMQGLLFALGAASFATGGMAHAHSKNHHTAASPTEAAPSGPAATPTSPAVNFEMTRDHFLEIAGAKYIERAKGILMRSCGDCHSDKTRYPWYHAIPGVRMMIDSDIAEAREHLDLSGDFPFRSHATPEEDLQALRKAVSEETMPPWSYKLMHSEAALSTDDRKALFSWIDESLEALNNMSGGVAK